MNIPTWICNIFQDTENSTLENDDSNEQISQDHINKQEEVSTSGKYVRVKSWNK